MIFGPAVTEHPCYSIRYIECWGRQITTNTSQGSAKNRFVVVQGGLGSWWCYAPTWPYADQLSHQEKMFQWAKCLSGVKRHSESKFHNLWEQWKFLCSWTKCHSRTKVAMGYNVTIYGINGWNAMKNGWSLTFAQSVIAWQNVIDGQNVTMYGTVDKMDKMSQWDEMSLWIKCHNLWKND